jgi:hypothetical protein
MFGFWSDFADRAVLQMAFEARRVLALGAILFEHRMIQNRLNAESGLFCSCRFEVSQMLFDIRRRHIVHRDRCERVTCQGPTIGLGLQPLETARPIGCDAFEIFGDDFREQLNRTRLALARAFAISRTTTLRRFAGPALDGFLFAFDAGRCWRHVGSGAEHLGT